jgi:ATP-dependent NAD(P)H-hydrate dehydratase
VLNLKNKDKRKIKKQFAQKLAEKLQVNILLKGHLDIIASPNNPEAVQCGIDGSPRRCGGQGDLLAGALVASYYWAIKSSDKTDCQSPSSPGQSPTITDHRAHFFKPTPAQVAAYAASTLIRTSCQTVFSKLGRSMISADVLKEIGPTFSKLFEKYS